MSSNYDPHLAQLLEEECETCLGWGYRSISSGSIEAFDGTNRCGLSAYQNRAMARCDGRLIQTTTENEICPDCNGTGRKAERRLQGAA